MFRNGRLFKRQINSIPQALSSSSAKGKNKEQPNVIKLIPPRINRTPIDILKVLSLTVGRDPTAFHYQIPDDPLFYPLSNFQKKKRILALESGKKSARWIVENNPGFFDHNLAEPPIKTFLNKPVFDENSTVTEEVLVDLIQDRNVSKAIDVYNLLEDKGIDVSIDAKQSLLELICFYNSKDVADEKNIWNKWYEMDKMKKNVWENSDIAKKLFDNLEPQCPLAYAAMIQGMLKHDNLNEAMELFGAGKEKKIKFPVGVYNGIIENITDLEEDPFKRFAAIETYLAEMAEEKVKPNLGTLNSVLKALSKIDGISLPKKESFVCQLLLDFKNLKIYPSLGSYYYILKIFLNPKENFQMSLGIAWSVMTSVKTKKWTVQHFSDFLFFPFAMQCFCFELKNIKLAQSLMDCYLDHDHYKFLNINFSEFQFFDNYIYITFMNGELKRAMEVYRNLVPSQTFLDIRRYGSIIKAFIHQKNFDYLEEIWKDMKQYLTNQFPKNTNVLSLVIKPLSSFKKEETPKFFYEVAEVLHGLLNTAELQPSTYGAMLTAFTRFEDEKKVSDVIDFILKSQVLFLEPDALRVSLAFAVSKKNIPLIKDCLNLSYQQNHPKLKVMAEEASVLLDEGDRRWLNEILGKVGGENKSTVEEPKVDPKTVKDL